MARQLAEKLERDQREQHEQEAKGDLRESIKLRIEVWQAGKKVLPCFQAMVCCRAGRLVIHCAGVDAAVRAFLGSPMQALLSIGGNSNDTR